MAILSYVTAQDGEGKVIQKQVATIVSFAAEYVNPTSNNVLRLSIPNPAREGSEMRHEVITRWSLFGYPVLLAGW